MPHEKLASRAWSCSSIMSAANAVVQNSRLPTDLAAQRRQQDSPELPIQDLSLEQLQQMLKEFVQYSSIFKIFLCGVIVKSLEHHLF